MNQGGLVADTVSLHFQITFDYLIASYNVKTMSTTNRERTFIEQRSSCQLHDIILTSGLEKSVTQLSGTSGFSFWANNFSFSLAQWVRAQASHLPTKKKN